MGTTARKWQDVQFLFKLARSGRIDWPEFKRRIRPVIESFSSAAPLKRDVFERIQKLAVTIPRSKRRFAFDDE